MLLGVMNHHGRRVEWNRGRSTVERRMTYPIFAILKLPSATVEVDCILDHGQDLSRMVNHS